MQSTFLKTVRGRCWKNSKSSSWRRLPNRRNEKPAISDLGWPFTPSHKSSPYFATYVGSVLQGLLELSSTCSWLDRSVSGQIVTTGRFPGWKAPTPNGLSRCYHLLADPLCKRYAVRVSRVQVNPTLSSAQVFETNRGPHMT